MIRNRILLKSIAVFLILETIFNTVAPTISWALTAGPTAPEATSFEPVDTTDVVNLVTGDFVYNVPLLQVPGPSGGYPVSLSYHGGISPDDEASWAGLGWNVGVGSINRTVNGYADDQVGAQMTRVDGNSGVERNTFGVGVGLPGVSFGVSVSDDSNLGVGWGVNGFVGTKVGPVGIGVDVGVNPYGEGAYAGLGVTSGLFNAQVMSSKNGVAGNVGLSAGMASGMVQIGVSTNFKSISISGSNTYGSVGANISSKGARTFGSVSSPINQTSSNAGRIRNESFGFTVPIPIGNSGLFLNLSYKYKRYYSYEKSTVNVIGSLQAKQVAGKDRDSWSFDSYALSDPDNFTGDIAANDPEKSKGGSFPAFDSYSVNAQGLSGAIQPYIFENGNLFRQNLKKQSSSDYEIEYKTTSDAFSRPVNFRFKNDFSNSFGYTKNEMRVQNGQPSFINERDNFTPDEGYNSEDQHLAGSKHIEWFSINQILDGTAQSIGFIPYGSMKNSSAYQTAIRNKAYRVVNEEQIGGFMVTNESGVTYHYALPAYAYNQYSKSKLNNTSQDVYQERTENAAYAYTWYLTAITGSDFVDRGGENGAANHKLDENDWGYWVSFDYGCWNDQYTWRNPGTGFHKDIDSNFDFYSTGQKEVYYLNEIKTKTHTAFFVKQVRTDGKSSVLPKEKPSNFFPVSKEEHPCESCPEIVTRYYKPAELLKLSSIILMDNKDVAELNLTDYRKNDFAEDSRSAISDNVLTNQFDQNITEITKRSIRIVKLDTDNSLCGNTPNSYDIKYDANGHPITDVSQYSLNGKLTLKGITFLGKGGSDLIPPITFGYDKNPDYRKDAADIWGFYKSDYVENPKDNLSKSVTSNSAENVDAWSLSTVQTSIGSKIQVAYESDDYIKPVAYKGNILQVASVVPQATQGELKITFSNKVDDLRQYIQKESSVSLMGVVLYWFHSQYGCTCDNEPLGAGWGADYKSIKLDASSMTVSQVNQSDIIVNSEKLYDEMTKSYGIYPVPSTLSYPKTNPNVPCYDLQGKETNLKVLYDQLPEWRGGNLSFTGGSGKFLGGGLRVKEIKVSDQSKTRITKYTYSNGVTMYEPFGLDNYALTFRQPVNGNNSPWQAEITRMNKVKNDFLKNLYGDFYKNILMVSRELPGPGVIYQQVAVEETLQEGNSTVPIPGKKVYEFEVFDDRILERIVTTSQEAPYAYTCKNAAGNTVPCFGSENPTTCLDQYGNTIDCGTPASSNSTPVTFNNFSALMGALKSVTEYGTQGEVLTRTENHYLHDQKELSAYKDALKTGYKNQGVISQVFNEYRVADGVDKIVFSKLTEYPLVNIGQTQTDYKRGITITSYNLAFDFYTGSPTKILSTDEYGNTYLTESVPAYTLSPYSGMEESQISNKYIGMGLKVKNTGNKNMLTQEAASYTYKIDPSQNNKKLGLVSAAVQTWSDQLPVLEQGKLLSNDSKQPGIWRKASNFTFVGSDNVSIPIDGLYPATSVTAFNAWNKDDLAPDGWQKTSAITLYDVNSQALEAQDMNNNFAATRMSPDQTRVVATAANVNYPEFVYSGAEGEFFNSSGYEAYLNGTVNTTTAHTGTTSLTAPAGARGFTYYMQSPRQQRTYRVSVWSSQPQAAIKYKFDSGAETAVPVTNKGKAGNWYLLEADIATNATSASKLELWCEAGANITYFDDFRVKPVDAVMTSYVYNQWGEVSHILDNNNLYTEYRYDAMGRLTSTYKESFKAAYGNNGIVKTGDIDYNYGTTNPYMLTINASSVGARGYIYPSGSVSIAQGKDLRFEMRDNCQYNNLGAVWIDGKKIDLDKSSVTLADGTIVTIQSAGKVIMFKNVQTAHTLKADFASNSVAGVVVCNGYTDGNGNTCYDGGYKYAYYDLCGNQGSWMNASRLAEIPSDLRSLATGNCCQYNNGTVSGCSCKPGSTNIE
ncbi:MAG TPA: hypothetical protein VIM75_19485 [Ohtaekwangia sp.]|uniref:hypothetical protein n=1 Tax=Ohtaekwangia sp. TaxID=2066019 RepID=UPI002F94AC36